MSKTTNKLGKPLYIIYLRCDADPVLAPNIKAIHKELDRLAKQEYNKPYVNLDNRQLSELHFKLNTGVFRKDEKKIT